MNRGVHHHLRANEFVILLFCDKDAVMTEICFLFHLDFDELDRLFHLIKNTSFKDLVFDDIHILANQRLCTIISDKADIGTWEKELWILSKQKNGGDGNLLLPVFHRDKLCVLTYILFRRFRIANPIAVFPYKIHVQIINGRIRHRFIFIIAYTFGIHERQTIVEIQFFVLVSDANKSLIRLIGMEYRTCLNMHQQHMVRLPLRIDTCHHFSGHWHGGIAEINWSTQNIIQLSRMIIHAFNPSKLVRYADGNRPAVRIGESAKSVRKICRLDQNALPVKYLLFIHCQNFCDGHGFSFSGSRCLLRTIDRIYGMTGMPAPRCLLLPNITYSYNSLARQQDYFKQFNL